MRRLAGIVTVVLGLPVVAGADAPTLEGLRTDLDRSGGQLRRLRCEVPHPDPATEREAFDQALREQCKRRADRITIKSHVNDGRIYSLEVSDVMTDKVRDILYVEVDFVAR